MAKKINEEKEKKKKTISLWDFYWQVSLASQRLVLIKKALGIECEDKSNVFDWIMEAFDGENIEVDENGEFEMSTGYVTIRGWKDPDTEKQRVDFYFDLSSN